MESGLYDSLTADQLLVTHQEIEPVMGLTEEAYKTIRPKRIPFISYPYEWCFSQLKDAALATLNIQLKALEFGMSLKDASAYNIQFKDGKPCLIDTLSFEEYETGRPWVAYRQFCQHFIAPLALAAYGRVRLLRLLRTFIDGIPLDLASSLLPRRTWLRPSLLSHIHLHSKSQQKYAQDKSGKGKRVKISRSALIGLITSLKSAVNNLHWNPSGTEWADYYDMESYSEEATICKEALISDFIGGLDLKTAWDLGANDGRFSRLASESNIQTVAMDLDPAAVEKNYIRCISDKTDNLLPLVIDLANPSPGLGWAETERFSLTDRGPVDLVLALALVHHLAISNNVPFAMIMDFFHSLGRYVIVEFIGPEDAQVQKLAANRFDNLDWYTETAFRKSLDTGFDVIRREQIVDSHRTLYLLKTV